MTIGTQANNKMTRFTQEYKTTSGLVFYLDPNTRNDPLPGINASARKPYKMVFFGAQRDWANDEEGWTRVMRHKRPNKKCRIQQDYTDSQSMA
jgi:hypothetical protein